MAENSTSFLIRRSLDRLSSASMNSDFSGLLALFLMLFICRHSSQF